MMKFLTKLLTHLGMTMITSGLISCSSMVAMVGTDVARYQKPHGDITRADVVKHLGNPKLSVALETPRPVKSLEKQEFNKCSKFDYNPNDSGKVVWQIDRYDFRGHICTFGDQVGAAESLGLACYSLGLSEVLTFPACIACKIIETNKSMFVFYDKNSRLLATGVTDRKFQPNPSVLP